MQKESTYLLIDKSITDCRAREIAGGELVECLNYKANCPYALMFGYGYFCNHARRKEIVRNTERLKSPP